ncbi:MAG: sialate O-acetylesterase [Ignavibacteriaceae bacterium]
MNHKSLSVSIITIFLIQVFTVPLSSQVKLPRLISDGMVLQRDTKVNIWGWALPDEKVKISFLDSVYSTAADKNGKWHIHMSDLKAGGPYEMEIEGSNTITIKDILVGDVWVASGQSQMDINMERVSPLYQEEIKKAGNSNLRYFSVPVNFNFIALDEDLQSGKWEAISRDNILSVSAISYFFADELYNKYNVPVGMIRASLGGSPAEAWLSEDALKEFPVHFKEMQMYKNAGFIDSIKSADSKRINEWYSRLNRTDEGYNSQLPYFKPEVNTADWTEMEVPGYWTDTDLGDMNGVVWFRKIFDIPAEKAGLPAKLLLGTIVDSDSAFVNGVYVGSTGYQYPPRRYKIPSGLLKDGENVIVIRVISNSGIGSFVPEKPYEIVFDDITVDLKGKWFSKLGTKMEPLQGETFIRWKPGGLFNGMIAPLSDYSIKGVIWYQGESNADRFVEYRSLFPAVINNWREKWGEGDFPFLFVQLHNFLESYDYPSEGTWAYAREAQTEALKLPNTGMAVAIDLGEWNDIHPLNKKDVAKRLVLAARKVAYNENDVVYSGPVYQSMEISENSIVLSFSNTGSGLTVRGEGELKHFAIAGEDKKFIWANAKINGNKVIVWNDKVTDPVSVRYAWANNPEGANLYNKEGLPAVPFRTDDWPREVNPEQ